MSEIDELDLSRLVSTLHSILEGQTAMENRLNQHFAQFTRNANHKEPYPVITGNSPNAYAQFNQTAMMIQRVKSDRPERSKVRGHHFCCLRLS